MAASQLDRILESRKISFYESRALTNASSFSAMSVRDSLPFASCIDSCLSRSLDFLSEFSSC